jgi:hypothetical protein
MTKINIIYFNLTRLLDPKKTITGNMTSKIYMYLGLVRPQKNSLFIGLHYQKERSDKHLKKNRIFYYLFVNFNEADFFSSV